MFYKILCVAAVCLLSAKARVDIATESPSTTPATNIERVKVSPKNVSDLYIGDLLRTKPKEVLEAAGSVHQPHVSSRNYVSPVYDSAAPLDSRTFNYKAHGGHEYVKTELTHPDHITHSRSNNPSSSIRYSTSPRVFPVLGHLLTVKPVRVVASDALPMARNSGAHQKAGDSSEDCSKSAELSYSSEDKSYIPEERTYRRAKQTAPDPQVEYRSTQSGHDEDDSSDRYSSYSDPSTGNYRSRTHPTDTNSKSHSSDSHTTSKSTSSSRTVNPSRTKQNARIAPTAASHEMDHDKDSRPDYGSQGIVVYKVKEPPSQGPSSYSDNAGREYRPSHYESEHNSGVSDSPYAQYTAEVRKPRTHSHGGRVHPQNAGQESVKKRPQQHRPSAAPSPAEHERESYGQSSYSPSGEQNYRDQSKPSDSYHHEQDYTSRPSVRGQEQHKSPYKSYENPESVQQYKKEGIRTQSSKRQRKPHHETVSSNERENPRYKSKERSTQGYDYSTEQPIQSSRLRSESPHLNYETYSQQDPRTESLSSSQSYERNQPDLRPSEEKEMSQYNYEATPHQVDVKHNSRSPKRQYRDSPRSIRSPTKYAKSVIVEGRSQLPAVRSEPTILVSRESKPYVSHSDSYSNSDFNANDGTKSESKVHYKNNGVRSQQQGGNPATEGRQSAGFDSDYQSVYKPYNSEYPASYANDPHINSQGQYQPQSYEQHKPYQQTQSYDGNPSQYNQNEEHRPYENNGPQGENYEDDDEDYDAPAKPNKNHHYISKVEGYKDEYSSSTPLHLDDAFFEKYGISKNAKIIVASAMKPNLFVADGTRISEGGHTDQEGGHSEPIEQQHFKPNFREDSNEDSYNESPEELGALKEVPGSFDDLVHMNPKFLRQLPQIMSPVDSFFKTEDSADASFDEDEFRNLDQKGFIVSQGPREIVQQHGDGVSRIIFNVPKGEGRAASTTEQEDYKDENRRKDDEDAILRAASTVLENIIKSDS